MYSEEAEVVEPMSLRDEDVGRVGEYVKPWLREIVEEMVPRVDLGGVGVQLLERMVRVEEELKAQRMLMDERFNFMVQRFAAVDRRFEELIAATDKRFAESNAQSDRRFAAVDKRFEESIAQSDRRFAAVDRRFDAVDERFEGVDKRFEGVDKRFDAVDKRFDAVDKRFDAVDVRFAESRAHSDKRFEDMNARFTTLTWMIGVGFVVITSLTTVFALFA